MTAFRMPLTSGRQPRGPVRATALAVAVLLAGGLLGCATPTAAPSGPPGTMPAPRPGTAVLRGTPIDPAVPERPALAVKIDNHPSARPQLGLDSADLVFEELVEGGLTRYAALWHSDLPDQVGPVRSVRPMDPEILGSFGGVVAYSGGQPQFIEMMRAGPLLNVVFDEDPGSGLFTRAEDRSSPHDLMLSATEVTRRHGILAPPTRQFDYADTAAASTAAQAGDPTGTLVTRFSESSGRAWSWDPAAQAYLRSQDGVADLDAAGVQLRASNVVVLRVQVDHSTEVPRTILTGSGEAWVSTQGRAMPATWFKDADAAPIRLADIVGASVDLAPGNTWIELVPTDGGSVELVP